MRIFSDKTNQWYQTVEDCTAAEKAYDEKVLAEKVQKDELTKKRADEAKAVEKSYKDYLDIKKQSLAAIDKAQKDYEEALTKFCDKYGAFHFTYRNNGPNPFDVINDIFFKLF